MHLSFVGIRRVRVDALVVDDVLEGSVHVAALAAVVAVFAGAVHQVLGAQVNQPPGGLGQLPLQGPRGAEGPAGATGALQQKIHISMFVSETRRLKNSSDPQFNLHRNKIDVYASLVDRCSKASPVSSRW